MTLKSIFARFGLLIIIALFFGFFSFISPVFLTLGNQVNIVEASAIVLILALGMTLVVAMGGIDLSIGIAFDFGAAFAVVALKDFGAAWYVACLIGVCGGALVGLLNAFLRGDRRAVAASAALTVRAIASRDLTQMKNGETIS